MAKQQGREIDNEGKEAFDRLQAFEAERKRRQTRTYVGYGVVAAVTIFFVMLVSGDKFNGILRIIGLQGIYNQKSGVYADCSDRSNRNNPYCQRDKGRTDSDWRALSTGGSRSKFSLHGK